MTRWLFLFLAVVAGWFSPANAHALTRADQAAYDGGAALEKVVFVAGITMDTFEGDQEDPLSLHKYLYCQANPVNMTDPSGHDGDVASLDVSMNLAVGIAAFSAVAITEAKTHAIATLAGVAINEAEAAGASASAATAYALSVYQTSVRDLIKQAQQALKQSGQLLKNLKVVPMPRSVIPNIAAHIATAGKPMLLRRVSPAQAVLNRAAAIAAAGVPPAGPGKSLDEYPFASSAQGGAGASVVPVPALENSIQGGIIGGCYTVEKINVGTWYYVVVTP